MDKFEQFFKENRLKLDVEDVDNSVWKNIEASMNSHNQRLLFKQLSIAAGVLIIISFGIWGISSSNANRDKSEDDSIFKNVSTELAKQENDYIRLIDLQLETVRKLEVPKEHVKIFDEFTQQLKILDNQYDNYKSEIQKSGYNQELIQQIIYNYQLKLSVLEMLQSEVEKINNLLKNSKNENNTEKVKLEI